MIAPSVLALVPARGGSKRLPGKNLRSFAGRPLIDWTLAAARAASRIGRIVLSSDDDALIERAVSTPGVAALRRPPELASDTATSVDVALHALEEEARERRVWDILVLLQPTSPLRVPGRIDAGIAMLAEDETLAAVIGVAPSPVHPFHCFLRDAQGRLEPAAGGPVARAARGQEMPAAFVLTGGFYAIRTEVLRSQRRFVPESAGALVCAEPGEEIDIDTAADFDAAEALAAAGRWVSP